MKAINYLLIYFFASSIICQLTFPLFHNIELHHNNRKHRHELISTSELDIHEIHLNQRNYHLSSLHFESTNISQKYSLTYLGHLFAIKLKIQDFIYNVQIDTGSSDFFIKGEQTSGVPSLKYKCGQQCLKNNSKYNLNYLDGTVETYERKLNVTLGTHKFVQSILVAYQTSSTYNDLEGILGLSFPILAKNNNPTFLQTLVNQRIIEKYAYSVNFNFQINRRSFISFGKVDSQFINGTMQYYSLIDTSLFKIKIKGIVIGASGLLSISTAVFDTGNTCVSIPRKYEQDILSSFNNKDNQCHFKPQQNSLKFSMLNCKISNFESLPHLFIAIDATYYSLQKEAYIKYCSRSPTDNIQNNFIFQGIWYCYLFIQSLDSELLILGDGFFNRYYTYFDLTDKKIGIARNLQNLSLNNVAFNKNFYNQNDWIINQQKSIGLWDIIKNFFSKLFS